MTITISRQNYNDICEIWHFTPQNIKEEQVNIPKDYFKLTSEKQNPTIEYVNIPCRAYRGSVVAASYYLLHKDENSFSLTNKNTLHSIKPSSFSEVSSIDQVEALAKGEGNAYSPPATVDEQIKKLKSNLAEYSKPELFNAWNLPGKEVAANTKKHTEAQNKYDEATSSSGRKKLEEKYAQEINLYNQKEGAKPLWLAYDPENGNMYKAVPKIITEERVEKDNSKPTKKSGTGVISMAEITRIANITNPNEKIQAMKAAGLS